MSFASPDDINPFQAPRAAIGAGPVDLGMNTDAELIRRAHLSHEASVKSIGSLYYLGAIITGLAVVSTILQLTGTVGNARNDPAAMLGAVVGTVFSSVMVALSVALGYGLSKLLTWARWTAVVLNGLGVLYFLGVGAFILLTMPTQIAMPALVFLGVVFLITGYVLYLLLSGKSGVVFSPGYKEVIAKTPHIKQKMSLILKFFLGLLVAMLVLILVAAVISMMR